ncbi:DUF1778 domain-containing protein [Thiohalophilus sp.]|uniref:type II toxin-antitoxin system TacA family antitoxin n=1 Tax=Thiohalophilus sp. TaxID=3028392 RepID=UPI002ACEEB37|nr:DUF1778 domain-containing protein [Thiohalophilus sp.]MDZ7662068.1 DUF1778 domain-containing protein [Thiohalophilus sp.]
MAHERTERIEMRVEAELKTLAERATAVSGYASMTDYIVSLIRENAPKTLEQHSVMTIPNTDFDRFMAICNETEQRPSTRIMQAAKRLDDEGYN